MPLKRQKLRPVIGASLAIATIIGLIENFKNLSHKDENDFNSPFHKKDFKLSEKEIEGIVDNVLKRTNLLKNTLKNSDKTNFNEI